MQKFTYVEEYIEALAGYDLLSKMVSMSLFPSTNNSRAYRLAHYDVGIVNNLANSTVWHNSALTDRQGELAVKLVLKYKKQFANNGIDVEPVLNPVWRRPLRQVDRTHRIWIEDDTIKIRFPYNQALIDSFKELRKGNQGSARFNREHKIWCCGITEYNVNFISAWAPTEFEIDPEVTALFDKILDCESRPYEIKLIKTNTGYTVANAADSLLEYISAHIGNDVVKLIDHAGILGYTVDTEIMAEASARFGPTLEKLGLDHTIYLDTTPIIRSMNEVFEYAKITNRYPICIYDPGAVDKILVDRAGLDAEDIVIFDHNGKTKTKHYNPHTVKLVYLKKMPPTWGFPVPLLVSTHQILHGGRKLDWINRAEKIVYLCKQL